MGYTGNEEPGLEELLLDPIADLLRRRDGLSLRQVRETIDEVRRKLARDAADPPSVAPVAADRIVRHG